MMVSSTVTDVLIVGGSHAGLSAALTLYRALHTSVIFDSRKPRNWCSSPTHLTPTWEHQSPEKLREASRAELQESGLCCFVEAEVERAEKLSNGLFQATDSNGGLWLGKKILLATGVKDIFPSLDGYQENYPQRIFPCLFQFGYEHRNTASAGLLALDGLANVVHSLRLADDAHKFADKVTIYTNANAPLAAEITDSTQYPYVRVNDRRIARLLSTSEDEKPTSASLPSITLEFVDGERIHESFLVHRPLTELSRKLSDQLELEYVPGGYIKTIAPFCQTSVEGVYAAGDCASMMKIIPNAMSMGAYAGAGIARELPKRDS